MIVAVKGDWAVVYVSSFFESERMVFWGGIPTQTWTWSPYIFVLYVLARDRFGHTNI